MNKKKKKGRCDQIKDNGNYPVVELAAALVRTRYESEEHDQRRGVCAPAFHRGRRCRFVASARCPDRYLCGRASSVVEKLAADA